MTDKINPNPSRPRCNPVIRHWKRNSPYFLAAALILFSRANLTAKSLKSNGKVLFFRGILRFFNVRTVQYSFYVEVLYLHSDAVPRLHDFSSRLHFVAAVLDKRPGRLFRQTRCILFFFWKN